MDRHRSRLRAFLDFMDRLADDEWRLLATGCKAGGYAAVRAA
jgi:hypothetical protein